MNGKPIIALWYRICYSSFAVPERSLQGQNAGEQRTYRELKSGGTYYEYYMQPGRHYGPGVSWTGGSGHGRSGI